MWKKLQNAATERKAWQGFIPMPQKNKNQEK